MRKSCYSETRVVRVLKEGETGKLVMDACREFGISDATYYNWKAKYGGMSASDLKGIKDMDADLAQGNQATEAQWGQPCSKGNAHRRGKLRCTFPASYYSKRDGLFSATLTMVLIRIEYC